MLRVDKGVPVRLVVYTLGMVYLFLDLFVFAGPLRQKIRKSNIRSPEQIAAAKAQGVVARFYGQPILLTQVDWRVQERVWKEGRKLEDVPDVERKVLRMAALNDLIDLRLLGRIKAWSNQADHPVEEAEVDAEVVRFKKKFDSVEEMREGLRQMGWTEEEMRMRVAAKLQQEKYLEALIDVEISEEVAREWYEEHKAELALPARAKVRQIFLSALKHEPEEAEGLLKERLAILAKGESKFEDAAKALSEDVASREAGGMLGWVQAGRLPKDFAVQVMEMKVKERAVVRTKMGWHLVEVLERKGSEERSFEAARADIEAALRAIKRKEGVRGYRNQLRAIERGKVEVFEDML